MQMEGRPRGQAPLGAAVARGQPPARPYPTPRGISEPAKRHRKERGRNPPAAILKAGRKSLRAVCGETMRAVPEPSEGGDSDKEVRLPTPRTARACTEHRITAKITTIRKKKQTRKKNKAKRGSEPVSKGRGVLPTLKMAPPLLGPAPRGRVYARAHAALLLPPASRPAPPSPASLRPSPPRAPPRARRGPAGDAADPHRLRQRDDGAAGGGGRLPLPSMRRLGGSRAAPHPGGAPSRGPGREGR